MKHTSIEEKRQHILDEMNARRIDHKTYIDSEWLLKEYETLFAQQQVQEAVREVRRVIRTKTFWNSLDIEIALDNLSTLKSKSIDDKTQGLSE